MSLYAPKLRREDEMCPDDDERSEEEINEDRRKLEDHWESIGDQRRGN